MPLEFLVVVALEMFHFPCENLLIFFFFFLMMRPPPGPPLFPTTPLFRSRRGRRGGVGGTAEGRPGPEHAADADARRPGRRLEAASQRDRRRRQRAGGRGQDVGRDRVASRSEEHTSELQSPCKLGCRLLLA